MAQKQVLRGEVGCTCVAREVGVERGGMGERGCARRLGGQPTRRRRHDDTSNSDDLPAHANDERRGKRPPVQLPLPKQEEAAPAAGCREAPRNLHDQVETESSRDITIVHTARGRGTAEEAEVELTEPCSDETPPST